MLNGWAIPTAGALTLDRCGDCAPCSMTFFGCRLKEALILAFTRVAPPRDNGSAAAKISATSEEGVAPARPQHALKPRRTAA